MTTIGEAIIEVRGDTSRLDSDVQRGTSSGKMGKFGAAAGGALAAGFTAAAGAALAGGAFLASAVGQASDLNETVNKSNVIFGKNADAIMRWSESSSTAFGLSQQEALASASAFGDMFSQIGFTSGAAAKMSKSTVQMAADLGSFNNLETSDVLDRISASLRGEFDSLQAVIPNINAARVEQEALARTGKTAASSLTAQEKAAATLAIIQKDGARAQGDFAKTSGGLANQQKILGAQWDDIKAKIGAGLLPVLTKVFGFITSTVMPALSNMGPAFSAIGTTVAPLVNALRGVFGSLSGGGGAGQMTATLAALRETFASVFAAIKSIVQSAVTIISALWRAFGGTIVRYITTTLQNVMQYVRGWFNVLAGIFKVISSVLRGDWKGAWEGIKQIVRGAVQMVTAVIKQMWNVIRTLFSVFATVVRAIFGRMWDGIKSLASAAFGAIRSVVSRGVSSIVDFVKGIPGKIAGLAGSFLNAGKELGSKVIGGIGDGLRSAGGFISDIGSAVKGAINSALGLPVSIKGPGPLPDFTIPAFARGTSSAPGGAALVGEQGPELVNLPRGSRVVTAARTAAMMRRAAGSAGSGGALRLVSGTLAIDESGRAFIRGVAAEEIEDADEFAGTMGRMHG